MDRDLHKAMYGYHELPTSPISSFLAEYILPRHHDDANTALKRIINQRVIGELDRLHRYIGNDSGGAVEKAIYKRVEELGGELDQVSEINNDWSVACKIKKQNI